MEAATHTAKYRDGGCVVREVPTGCRSKGGALPRTTLLRPRSDVFDLLQWGPAPTALRRLHQRPTIGAPNALAKLPERELP
jgi:hypothetical protein